MSVQNSSTVRLVAGSLLLVGFYVAVHYLGELGGRLGVGVELRLLARHPGRVLSVNVREVRTVGRGRLQQVRLAGEGKEEWLTVPATRAKLMEALTLARETTFA